VPNTRMAGSGRVHHISAETLAAPYSTPSAHNPPKLVRRPHVWRPCHCLGASTNGGGIARRAVFAKGLATSQAG
jgi:hypothetical protein